RGACAARARVPLASTHGARVRGAGRGYDVRVIAAVVVGGVAIVRGSGSVVGAALGALLLNTILAALSVSGVSPFWTQAISGMLILVAITLDPLRSLGPEAVRGRRRAGHARGLGRARTAPPP